MTDVNAWMADYLAPENTDFAEESTQTPIIDTGPDQISTPRGKRPKKTGPWYPRFPSRASVTAMRLQFFDNVKPGTGKSRYTLKIRVYHDRVRIDQFNPDWERTVGLVTHKQVETWAKAQHQGGHLTDEQLERYQAAIAQVQAWSQDQEVEFALMGHIGSPPGTHYFHGQFLTLVRTTDGAMSATLHVDGETIKLDRFYRNTSSNHPKAPKLHALYDPLGLIDRNRQGGDDE